jgi:hypothetical protein
MKWVKEERTSDEIAVKCRVASFGVDFSREWFWKKWKQDQILGTIMEELKKEVPLLENA